MSFNHTRKYGPIVALTVLAAISMTALLTALDRPLWFDEAVSVMNFATLPYHEIYTDYAIPNNHILFNVLLKLWLNTGATLLAVSDVQFRLLPLIISLTVIATMFSLWRKRFGNCLAFILTLSFAVSTPFIIYGTALRGYMLSILFTLLGMEFSMRWRESGKLKNLSFYFFSALMAVATIPTNLVAFAAITFLPPTKEREKSINRRPTVPSLYGREQSFAKKRRNFMNKCLKLLPTALARILRERFILGVLPLLAFVLFYAPLWKSLHSALKHNNGWMNPLAACEHLYLAFLVAFLPILPLALAGAIRWLREGGSRKTTNILMAFIVLSLPALVTIVRTPSPFPRVFIPFWPIWLYLAGMAMEHWMRRSVERAKLNVATLMPFCGLTIILWALLVSTFASDFSNVFTRRHSQDDFFSPYYMRSDFNPLETVKLLKTLSKGIPRRVYLSQNCDFPSIIFYGKLKGLPTTFWVCDFPGKKAPGFARGASRIHLAVRNENDLSLLLVRLTLTDVAPEHLNSFQKIYSARRRPAK